MLAFTPLGLGREASTHFFASRPIGARKIQVTPLGGGPGEPPLAACMATEAAAAVVAIEGRMRGGLGYIQCKG